MNNYLIPANTKKSQLILGFFTLTDLIIFIVGVVWSFIMLVLIKSLNLPVLILIMLPALIATFLVMPVPHYHNILQLLTNIFSFYTNRRQYFWKGWCIHEGNNSSK
ncbi:MAG: hypothetical protein E7161_00325 [Firmicutes bacterium]|nr:hypothetical protein [Bacillota bacterium]